MRLNKIEQIIPIPLAELRQRITVTCEQNPKRFSNHALHSNQEKISFSVDGQQGDSVVYAIVTGTPVEDGSTTRIAIETYLVSTNWPIWLTVTVLLILVYVLFFKPASLFQWIPVIVFMALTIRPMFLPLFRSKTDERALVASIHALLSGYTDKPLQ